MTAEMKMRERIEESKSKLVSHLKWKKSEFAKEEVRKDLLGKLNTLVLILNLIFLRGSQSEQQRMIELFSSPDSPIIEPSSRSFLPPPEVIIHEAVPVRQQDTVHELDKQVGDRLIREESEEGWLWRGVPKTFDEILSESTKKLEEKGITDVHRAWFVDQSLESETGEEGRILTEEDTIAFGSQAQLIVEKILNSDIPGMNEFAYKVGTNSNNVPILVAECYNNNQGIRNLLAIVYPHEGEYHFVSPSEDPRIRGGSLFFRRGLVSATTDSPLGRKDFVWKHNEWVLINQPEGHHFIWEVRPGDTLWKISEMYGIPLEPLYDALERAEGHRDAKKLQAGTELRIEAVPSRAPFVGLKIPEIEDKTGKLGTGSLFIEPSWITCYTDGSCLWKYPDEDSNAWILAEYPNVVSFHRNTILGEYLADLDKGDEVVFYENYDPPGTGLDIEDGPFTDKLRLQVDSVERIKENEEESKVWSRAKDDLYALVSCEPPGDPTHPQRIVIWLRPS